MEVPSSAGRPSPFYPHLEREKEDLRPKGSKASKELKGSCAKQRKSAAGAGILVMEVFLLVLALDVRRGYRML